MSSDPQAPGYTYTSPSAQSTRQLLESIAASDASSFPPNYTNKPPSADAPTQNQRLSTANYADADARVRAAIVDAAAGGGEPDDMSSCDTTATTGSVGWRPRLSRAHSWNQQDLKHELHMGVLMMGDGAAGGPGFSEVAGAAGKKEI